MKAFAKAFRATGFGLKGRGDRGTNIAPASPAAFPGTDGTGAPAQRSRRLAFAFGLVLALLIVTTSASASKVVVSSFCEKGTAGGQCGAPLTPTSPRSVAVNQSTSDLYVADTQNNRVEEFRGSGAFIRTWGWGVVSGTSTAVPNQSSAIQTVTVKASTGTFTLTYGGQTTAALAFNAAAAQVQSALDALPTIGGAGAAVAVTGGPGASTGQSPYLITFGGSLGNGATVSALSATATGLGGGTATVGATYNPSGTGFEVCDTTAGDTAAQCGAGATGSGPGEFQAPSGIAISPTTGDVYVSSANNGRVDEFTEDGAFIRRWGAGVVALGPDQSDETQTVTVAATGGDFALGFGSGGPGISETAEIPAGAPASQVQGALDALTNVSAGGGSVAVSGGPGSESGSTPYVVSFDAGPLAGTDVAQMTAASGAADPLTGGAAIATVATTNPGATGFEVCDPAVDTCGAAGANVPTGGGIGTAGGGNRLAVEPGSGDVFVADSGNLRLQAFGPGGAFLEAIGWNVVERGPDNTVGGELEVCRAQVDVCQKSTGGTAVGQFSTTTSPSSIAVDPTGDVYALDFGNQRIEKFTPSAGTYTVGEFAAAAVSGKNPFALAIDPADGHLLAGTREAPTAEERVVELGAAGELLETHGEGNGINEGVATNVSAGGLAAGDAAGVIYLAVPSTTAPKVDVLGNPPDPTVTIAAVTAVGPTNATAHGTVDPEGFGTAYRFEYSTNDVTWTRFPATDVGVGSGSSPVSVEQTLGGLQPNLTYHLRLTALDVSSPAVQATSAEVSFETSVAPPLVSGTVASPVTPTSAKLTGYVNPDDSPTSYHYEWGATTAYGSQAPVETTPFVGSGGQALPAPVQISGLQPATTYHFRLVAASPDGTTRGPDEQFTTLPASCPNEALRAENSSSQLPECRAYEQVTPTYKEDQPVHGFGANFWFSADGLHAIAHSEGVFAGATNSPGEGGGAEYGSARTGAGWTTAALEPSAAEFPAVRTVDILPDGTSGIWEARTGADSAEAISLYRSSPDGAFTKIGPLLPPQLTAGPPDPTNGDIVLGLRRYLGASLDLSHVFFGIRNEKGSEDSMWPGDGTVVPLPQNPERRPASLYEYVGVDGSRPALVGLDNDGDQISECGTGLGAGGTGVLTELLSLQNARTLHAISAGGTTVFFAAAAGGCLATTGTGAGPATGQLYARIGSPGEPQATVNVAGTSGCITSVACDVTSEPTYQGAAADGSRVFFTSTQQLVGSDRDAADDLYECDLPGDAGATPTPEGDVDPCPALVPVSVTGTADGANVQKVLAVSADGSRVYYTATGVVTDAPNQQGQTARRGADNLYLATRDGGSWANTYVATLDSAEPTAQATPDGRYLLFLDSADLTPDDTSSAVAQLFRYDAASGDLIRISRGQDGYDEDGNTEVNAVGIPAEGTHETVGAMSADGSTVVFTTKTALTPDASAGDVNLYAYHDGNVGLLYSSPDEPGTSTAFEVFGIGSAGTDVFLGTSRPLASGDTDTQFDLYDIRRGGGFPAPRPATRCDPLADSSCQGPTSAAPSSSPPPSLGFSGPGNEATRQPVKAKRHHKKKSKKSTRHHRHKLKAHRRTRGRAAGNNHGGSK